MILGVLALAAAAACGSDTAPVPSPIGSYSLATVDSRSLPATELGSDGPWFVRGSLSVRADGTYSLSTTDSTRFREVTAVNETGTWTFRADSVFLQSKTPGRDSGPATLAGDLLVRKIYTHAFEFRRSK